MAFPLDIRADAQPSINQLSIQEKSWGENLPQGIAIDPNPRLLNDSEVAVTIAHIEAYKMIIENGWNYAMVIEDDAVFLDGFAETFCRNFCLTPADWDLIFFGNGCGYRWKPAWP